MGISVLSSIKTVFLRRRCAGDSNNYITFTYQFFGTDRTLDNKQALREKRKYIF